MKPRPNNSAPRELPTMSLYLRDALQSEGLWTDWENCRTGPFSFRFDNQLVIVRYATGEEVDLARSIRADGGRVIYLVDDDLAAITADSQLPGDYRSRIEAFLIGPWQELRKHINEAVVSSPALAEIPALRAFESVTVLDPFWEIPTGNRSSPDRTSEPKIAWLCTRSHTADLESISGDLRKVLAAHPGVSLTVFFGKQRPAWIRKMPGLVNLDPLPWPDYRRWLADARFDVALYPLLDTAVNRARSINKFLEHAVTGAASVISSAAPFLDRLESGDCLAVDNGEWTAQLESLLTDRDRIADIAGQARRRAREIAEAARHGQIEFWKSRLPVLENRTLPDRARI